MPARHGLRRAAGTGHRGQRAGPALRGRRLLGAAPVRRGGELLTGKPGLRRGRPGLDRRDRQPARRARAGRVRPRPGEADGIAAKAATSSSMQATRSAEPRRAEGSRPAGPVTRLSSGGDATTAQRCGGGSWCGRAGGGGGGLRCASRHGRPSRLRRPAARTGGPVEPPPLRDLPVQALDHLRTSARTAGPGRTRPGLSTSAQPQRGRQQLVAGHALTAQVVLEPGIGPAPAGGAACPRADRRRHPARPPR